jgi:hypothetical protein
MRRSFVRTNAAPLPGLTCWNSTTLKIVPSTSMWLPFLNWLVLMMVDQPFLEPNLDVLFRAGRRPHRRIDGGSP